MMNDNSYTATEKQTILKFVKDLVASAFEVTSADLTGDVFAPEETVEE